ncbi:MAG: SUMF1/EgtB/PvdO family nonheme iron enzyme, partial [Flavobacteriaceae bacterium]|nr:SUMF1/EgtB/PvdO family nonheme iron enzyme [Flavobacteriaceae bacterium]
MKIEKLILLLTLISSFVVFTSCGNGGVKSGGGTKKFTSTTGWKPNQKGGWFFTGKTSKEKTWGNMVFVEGGTFTMGAVKDDVMHDWNNSPKRMQVRSFDIGEAEVTNYEYREYVTWIKYVFPPQEPIYQQIYLGALPDTLVWGNKLSRNDIYSEEY